MFLCFSLLFVKRLIRQELCIQGTAWITQRELKMDVNEQMVTCTKHYGDVAEPKVLVILNT